MNSRYYGASKIMKILYVTSFFMPEISGISYHVYNIAKRMKCEYGHSVTIYTYSPKGYLNPPTENVNGLDVMRFRSLVSNRYELHLISARMLMRLLANTDYDVVHVHGYGNLEPLAVYLPGKIRRNLKKHAVLTPHYHPRSTNIIRNLARAIYDKTLGRSIFSAFPHVIALTVFEKNLLSNLCDSHKITVIPNGIDLSEIEKAHTGLLRAKFGLDESCKCILYAGNLLKYKGVQYLIYAFKNLSKYIKNVKLLIIGDGPYKYMLLRMTRELSVEQNVIFTGFLQRKILLSTLKACDVFVMPSSYEAFSMITAEAMACGKPVIACNVGGLPELGLSPKLLVEYGDVHSMTRLIIHILENDDIARDIGLKNQSIVFNNFSWENLVNRIQDLYLEVMASRELNVETRNVS